MVHVIRIALCFRFRSWIIWRTYHCSFPSTKISVTTPLTCHATSTSVRIRHDPKSRLKLMACRMYRYKEKTTVIDCIYAVNSGVQRWSPKSEPTSFEALLGNMLCRHDNKLMCVLFCLKVYTFVYFFLKRNCKNLFPFNVGVAI